MARSIRIKRSAVPGKAPAVADLALGELAVNTHDGKLYTKKNDGTESIVEIGSGAGGGTGGGAEALNDLSDVTLGSPEAGQVLKYNGSAWVNAADATGGGGVSGITVGTYGANASDVGTAVTALRFDKASGFSVVQGPDGATEARVSLNSTFKTWHVAGQSDLVAEGEDEITIEAGTGITLSTTPTGTKKLKIDGFDGAYSNLSGKPTLGTAAASAASDFATAAQGAKADSALQPTAIGTSVQAYDASTVVDASYVHTDNNFTSAEKSKLEGIAAGAEVNVNADWNAATGDAAILNKPTLFSGAYSDLTGKPTLFSGAYADLSGKPDLSVKADLVNGKLSTSQLPDLAISEYLGDVASQAAMLAKTGQRGDWVVRTDTSEAYMLVADGGALLADWRKIATPADAVQSVAGKTGAVTLVKGDVGLGNVDNTSDASKPVSTATQTALDAKAPLASPSLTGTPTAPTATAGTNTTQIASTAFVTTAVSSKQPLDADLTAIAGLTGTSGILKKTAADTWTLDTSSYLTGNQNITVSGDASGSGTTSISLTLGNTGVTAGTYNDSSVAVRPFTVDAKGRITSVGSAVTITPGWSSITSKPTTVAGYGITDAAPLASPAFSGTPTAPTAAADTSTTQLATTAYVVNQGYLKASTASSTYALTTQIASTASELEAQAGTNNTKMMTPLRVAQAITALGGGGGGGGGGGSSGPTYTDQMYLVSAGVF